MYLAQFIPLATALPPLRKFAAQYSQPLARVECHSAFNEVLDLLGRLDQFAQESAAVDDLPLSLLPLSCGHNGTMSKSEQGDLLQHLTRAKWMAK